MLGHLWSLVGVGNLPLFICCYLPITVQDAKRLQQTEWRAVWLSHIVSMTRIVDVLWCKRETEQRKGLSGSVLPSTVPAKSGSAMGGTCHGVYCMCVRQLVNTQKKKILLNRTQNLSLTLMLGTNTMFLSFPQI